jgi:hypothetical protein
MKIWVLGVVTASHHPKHSILLSTTAQLPMMLFAAPEAEACIIDVAGHAAPPAFALLIFCPKCANPIKTAAKKVGCELELNTGILYPGNFCRTCIRIT